MYFEDGTSYQFLDPSEADDGTVPAINVGWLGAGHAFNKGRTPPSFLPKLFATCARPVNRTRGFHVCELCKSTSKVGDRVNAEQGGIVLVLGSAEIRVRNAAGVLFASPDLIYHYVDAHDYLPPAAFIEAVLGVNGGADDST